MRAEKNAPGPKTQAHLLHSAFYQTGNADASRKGDSMVNDAAFENYYLNRWKDITGDDYFDDEEEFEDDVPDEDDYDDYLFNKGMDEERDSWERDW